MKKIVIACLVPGILAFSTLSPLNAATNPSVATPSTTSAPTAGMTAVIRYLGGTVPNAQMGRYIGIKVASDAITFSTACKEKPAASADNTDYQPICDQSSFKNRSNWAQPYTVAPTAVKTTSLSEDKHHRIGIGIVVALIAWPVGIPIMFTSTTKHFIAITWDDNGKAGSAEFQADKNEYRGLLATLSGVSGVTVTDATGTYKK